MLIFATGNNEITQKHFKHMYKRHIILYCLAITLFACCNDEKKDILLHRMEEVRAMGDTAPLKALEELYALEPEIASCKSDYAYHKYLLLRTRLQDKAFILPCSTDTIETIVGYFSEHGNNEEQMEAYYYEGSVYRDLKDFPRSIKSFLKVLDLAEESGVGDCQLLQNTYSQLSWQYNKQLVFSEALKMAKAGCSMAERTNTLNPRYIMDVATAARHASDSVTAAEMYKSTLDFMRGDTTDGYPDIACELLAWFSNIGMKDEAEACLSIIRKNGKARKAHNYNGAMADYFHSISMYDSAMAYNKTILEESSCNSQRLCASHNLMDYCFQTKSYEEGARYATLYAQYVDSLFEENMYEQTSRACGSHLYTISLEKEKQAQQKVDTYKERIYCIIAFFISSVLVAGTAYYWKKCRFIRLLLAKEYDLKYAKEIIQEYDERLEESRVALEEQKQRLACMEAEKRRIEDEMNRRVEEKEAFICQQDEDIRVMSDTIACNELTLMEKQRQINDLVRVSLSQRALLESPDIIQKFHDASAKDNGLDESDWQRLYATIEAMHPDLMEAIRAMPRNSELGTKTACLMIIGMTNPQIATLTKCARTTVWDRVNRIRTYMEEVLGKFSPVNLGKRGNS